MTAAGLSEVNVPHLELKGAGEPETLLSVGTPACLQCRHLKDSCSFAVAGHKGHKRQTAKSSAASAGGMQPPPQKTLAYAAKMSWCLGATPKCAKATKHIVMVALLHAVPKARQPAHKQTSERTRKVPLPARAQLLSVPLRSQGDHAASEHQRTGVSHAAVAQPLALPSLRLCCRGRSCRGLSSRLLALLTAVPLRH